MIGRCEYGVVGRPKEKAFLLRHYPKAVVGVAEEVNRMQPRSEVPFEIQATFDSGPKPAGAASGHGPIAAPAPPASSAWSPCETAGRCRVPSSWSSTPT